MTNYLKQSWLVLLLASVLAGGLAVVERSLEGHIAQNARERLQAAIRDVVSGGSDSEIETLDGIEVYRVTDKRQALAGWALPAETLGFADKIKLLIGLSADGRTITGVAVLESRETPGLGEKIRDADFREQFAGQPSNAELTVVKSGESAKHPIDAITGATISSAAVTRAVNVRVAQSQPYLQDRTYLRQPKGDQHE